MNSTKKQKRTKPKKPRTDFPLQPHATGRWAKKFKGKLHYFGPWEDPDLALRTGLDDNDGILTGHIAQQTRRQCPLQLRLQCWFVREAWHIRTRISNDRKKGSKATQRKAVVQDVRARGD